MKIKSEILRQALLLACAEIVSEGHYCPDDVKCNVDRGECGSKRCLEAYARYFEKRAQKDMKEKK